MVELSMANSTESKKVIWLKRDKWRAKLSLNLQRNVFNRAIKLLNQKNTISFEYYYKKEN